MDFRSLFNLRVPAAGRGGDDNLAGAAATDPPSKKEGAFVSAEALFSFAGMTATITLATSIIKHLGFESVYTGAVLTVMAGVFLYYVHDDPDKIEDKRDFVRITVAVVNTLQLYAAVYGISKL